MSLVLGATHVVSVPTVFTIAEPVGLSVHMTGIPNFVPRDVGAPAEYHGLARLNLGNALGYLPHHQLVMSPQLIFPLSGELTLCSVNMTQGVTVTVDEIVSSTWLTRQSMPWDRSPAPVSALAPSVMAGAVADTVVVSYTVPAGRILLLQRVVLQISRLIAATTASESGAYMTAGGSYLGYVRFRSNVVGDQQVDAAGMSGQVFLPGTVILGRQYSLDTGGQLASTVGFSGTLFNL